MRIGLGGRPARWLHHRALPAGLTFTLLVTVTACRPQLPPPGAPTSWPATSARHWQWQWQVTGVLDPDVEADVFVLDPVDTTAAETAQLRSRSRRLVCQVHIGSVHPADPDASRYPAQVRGATAARTGRIWLDVRRWDALRPVLADRFRLCRGKGFGAVVFADADGYDRRSGFALEFDHQLQFNRRVAALARSLDLSPACWATCRRSPRWRRISTSPSTRSASGCASARSCCPSPTPANRCSTSSTPAPPPTSA
ncbi:hypothetical protein GCM10029963_30680 [Micromonospora andamanensis]